MKSERLSVFRETGTREGLHMILTGCCITECNPISVSKQAEKDFKMLNYHFFPF